MRSENAMKNTLANLTVAIITNILNFATRTFFIKLLGASYLGLNGILINVLSMLSLAELGIGTAISFSLYEPIANNNINKIKSIMNFYKKTYRFIGIFVLIIGIFITIFSNIFVNDDSISNVKLIFFIYIFSNSLTYFISYKNTLLEANQKNYRLFFINAFFGIVTPLLQLATLFLTKTYIYYLLVQLLLQIFQRIMINRKITKIYPFLSDKMGDKLDKKELDIIKKNVGAMFFHKIGDYVINGTSNIIISIYISLAAVGYYSNYLMLIGIINSFLLVIFNSFTSSIGNSLLIENKEYNLKLFERVNFLAFWLYGFATISFYVLINPFISLWIGNNYILSNTVVIGIILNFYLTGMRIPITIFKNAAGLYSEDKYVPLIQAIILLAISLPLVKSIGILGVVLGLLFSSLLPSFYRPYIIYKNIFKKKSSKYFRNYIRQFSLIILMAFTINIFLNQIYHNNILSFSLRFIISSVLTNIIFVLLFYQKQEFKYIVELLKGRKKWKRKLQ